MHDLEALPWPWGEDSVEEIVLNHVLEHLGATPGDYINILKEIYRVCRDGAAVRITVPHPRHDHFLDDPTHRRPVTPLGLSLFSRERNRRWIAEGLANSPLGLYHGVDFDLVETCYVPGEAWFRLHPGPNVEVHQLLHESSLYNNVVQEIRMVLKVIKPPR